MSLILVALTMQMACSSLGSEAIRDVSPQTPTSVRQPPERAAPEPLKGRTRTEICKDDALLLSQYPIEKLENTGWTAYCCGAEPVYDDGRCELDWPSSDVPSCALWDELRNQIYARHGYPFAGDRWRRWAGVQPWYERREDFTEDWLGSVARDNIETLKRYAKERHNCG